jgi:hypothetical protein
MHKSDPYAVPPTAAAPDEDHPHGDESTAAPANTDPAIGSDGVEPEPGDTAIRSVTPRRLLPPTQGAMPPSQMRAVRPTARPRPFLVEASPTPTA